MDRDKLGMEIKKIMEDEARDIEFSQGLKNNILQSRKITIRERIVKFLNKEIELPLIPMIATLSIIVVLTGFPWDLIKKEEMTKTISIGSSQIIIKDEGRVSRRDED